MSEELRIIIDEGGAGTTAPATVPVTPGAPAPQPGAGGSKLPPGGATKKETPELGAATAVASRAGVSGSATSTATAAAAFGPLGIAAGVVTLAFGAAALATRKYVKTVEEQVTLLAGVSGPVAAAKAESEVRQQLALLRRGQRIGPQVAQAERTRAKFEEALFDVNTAILQHVLSIANVANPIVDSISEGLKLAAENKEFTAGAFTNLLTMLVPVMGPLAPAIQAWLVANAEASEEERERFTTEFMKLLPENEDNQPMFWPDDLGRAGTF